MELVRVALVDDSVAIRFGLPVMLPNLAFVGRFETAEALLSARPVADVVALDLKLSDGSEPDVLNGLRAVRAVANAGYRVCIYTDDRRRFVLAQCMRAGASGIVHKTDPAEIASEALCSVAAGETVITQSLVGLAEVLERRGGMPELTTRQREVLSARARGEAWARIGQRLFITEGVAREHMAAVIAKFDRYMKGATPAEVERQLGLCPGDLADPG